MLNISMMRNTRNMLASASKATIVRAASSSAIAMKDPLEFEPLPEKYLSDPLDETGICGTCNSLAMDYT